MNNRFLKILSFCLLVFVLCSCQTNQDVQSQQGPKQEDQHPWQPNYDEPWNFTPAQTKTDRETDWGYDIVFSTEKPAYTADVELIRGIAVNQTGEWMYVSSGTPFIEKFYMSAFPNPYGSVDAWVRLPYYPDDENVFGSYSSADNDAGFVFYPKYLKNGCVLTPGEYRMVVYLADGPHYAYFEITE